MLQNIVLSRRQQLVMILSEATVEQLSATIMPVWPVVDIEIYESGAVQG